MDENKPSSQIPLPGIAVMLLILGVLVLTDAPFKPSRPGAASDITSTAEDVIARLWQDPFEAVEVHRKEKHAGDEYHQLKRLKSNLSDYTMYQDKHHRVCSPSNEKELDEIKRSLQQGSGNPASSVYVAREDKEVWALIENAAHTINELRCQIQRDVKVYSEMDSDLHILAVMVPGGPYAENRETRIRSRYAVITGLSNAGYIPKDAEHIGYMDFSDLCDKALEGQPVEGRYCDWPANIPYEWFVAKETMSRDQQGNNFANTMLVLWIDEEELAMEKPLFMLNRLRKSLTPGTQEARIKAVDVDGKEQKKKLRIKFDVIGPASSTTLAKMYREADEAVSNKIDKYGSTLIDEFSNSIRVVSPRTTIDEAAIKNILEMSQQESLAGWFNFQRTIPTDEKLVGSLLCELLRRGVNPYWRHADLPAEADGCADYSRFQLNRNNRQDHIVLIGEWDTVYSRNFNALFKAHISEQGDYLDPEWLHSYNYYRGIDGETAQKSNTSAASENAGEKKGKKVLRRAVGANQFDYLRRLGDQLIELSEDIQEHGAIRAIGVVGSDTYDKLLILQALRGRFPDVIFFTTDLDARMLHHEENEWARNLVVASGYGLRPVDRSYQGLPFRDGYQTSLYHTVLKVAHKDEAELKECMSVKIFEIGNRYAVDYSHSNQCDWVNDVGKSDNSDSNRILCYLLLLLLLFTLLLVQTSKETRKFVMLSALLLFIVLFWISLYETDNNIEFREMMSGTSIWPAIIIRMTAGAVAIISIFYVISSLRKNNNMIISRHELAFNVSDQFGERVCQRLKLLSKGSSTYAVIFSTILNEGFESIKAILFPVHYKKQDVNERGYERLSIWTHLFITLWGWSYDKKTRISIDEIIYQYLDLGRTRWWIVRVLSMWLLYITLTMLFMRSFSNAPFAPFSGEVNAVANFTVLIVSVFSYLFLIFLVVDVTRLNARFVELITRSNIKWPGNVVSRYCSEYGVSEDIATEKLKLDLIVLRSKSVDVLIFLPFVVLSLMILSRSSYFDHWHMSMQLAFVILLGAMIALGSAIRLRRSARKARLEALNNLEELYKKQTYEESKHEISQQDSNKDLCRHKMAERIMTVIDEIKSINAGPFVPIAKHPIVAAVAMPFGGVGGLYLIDYIANVGL